MDIDLLIEERAKTSQYTQVFRKKYDFLNRITWEATFSNEELLVEKLYSYDAHSNCIQTEWRKGEESAIHEKEFDDLNRSGSGNRSRRNCDILYIS